MSFLGQSHHRTVRYVVKGTYLDFRPETLIPVMRSLLFTNGLSRGKNSFLVQEKSPLSLYVPKFICLIEHRFYRTLLQVAEGGREDTHNRLMPAARASMSDRGREKQMTSSRRV